MPDLVLPEALIQRFRTSSFERLERIDGAWATLTHGTGTPEMEEGVFRDLHTMKGDARVVGFADVAVLCQRLEDLMIAARGRQYRVHEEVDIVVTMAIQFVGMLLRKKAGIQRTGIDLEGFLAQIQEVLIEWFRRSEAPAAMPVGPHLRLADAPSRVSPAAGQRLSSVATTVYLEHLRATDRSRERLFAAWKILSGELGELAWVPIEPILASHAASALILAKDLGKEVDISVEAAEVKVSTELIDVLNTAVLHTLRNAVDHGIEAPHARMVQGRRAAGAISVRALSFADAVEVTVRDDGTGIDLAKIQQRGAALGLLTEGDEPSTATLLDLVFHPGLSTRDVVSEISGRGVGMDAVRVAVKDVGGTVTLASDPGHGTAITIRLPQTRSTIDVHAFRAPGTSLLFVIDSQWIIEELDPPPGGAIDAVAVLDLATEATRSVAGQEGSRVLRLRYLKTEVILLAGASHAGGTAHRICVTSPEEPLEVVTFNGADALLLRPEKLLDRPAARGEA